MAARQNKRVLTWEKEDNAGLELAEVTLTSRTLRAVGVAIGTQPVPYRLDYRLVTRAGFVTSRLLATTRGDGWQRTLDMRRSPAGEWTLRTSAAGDAPLPAAGGDPDALKDAIDCDLGLSPLTNTLPVLRCELARGGPERSLVMAWVAVPELAVHADGQRYAFVEQRGERLVVRFTAADGSFASDITFDGDGLVVDYPGIARRLA